MTKLENNKNLTWNEGNIKSIAKIQTATNLSIFECNSQNAYSS